VSTSEQVGGGRDELSSLLRQLRKDAELSGVQAGKLAGISQSKISRFEAGIYVPSLDEIKTLARIYEAPGDIRRRLVELATDLQQETTPARVVLSRGAASFQARVGRIERASQQIRTFTPTLVPGLVQTKDYARAIFAAGDILGASVGDVDAVVQERLSRQQVLEEPGRSVTLLMSEGALCWQAHSPEVMIEQLEQLARMTRSQTVRVGVIPWTVPVRVFPLHGFDLYDRRAVMVGTETATALMTEPADVQAYDRLFSELEKLAVFGSTAQAVFAGQAEEYRGLL
jgi:transcriptional regulator with XRE-family HTH domain